MPDGRHVVFSSDRDGAPNLYRKAVDGTGATERLSKSSDYQLTVSVTPDGTRVVFVAIKGTNEEIRPFHLAMLHLKGDPTVEPLLDTGFDIPDADLSPDGHWLAYESNPSGAYEVYVRPFPDVDSGRWQISRGGGFHALWGPDGHELFFQTREGQLMRVPVEPELRPGNPETLLKPGYWLNPLSRSFDISPDGRRFLMMKEAAARAEDDPYAGLTQLVVVQNWFDELKRRVPVERSTRP